MRVGKVEPPHADKQLIELGLQAGIASACRQPIEIVHQDSWMPFALWPEIPLNPQVQLQSVGAYPQATTSRQLAGLGHLGEPEDAEVKLPACGFPAGRNWKLDMMDAVADFG